MAAATEGGGTVLYEQHGRVAIITLNRPEVLNALNKQTMKELESTFADVGKRRYTVRFTGKYTVEDLGGMIIEWRDGRPVRLSDVATVIDGLEDTDQSARFDGLPAVLISVFRIGNQDALWTLLELEKIV